MIKVREFWLENAEGTKYSLHNVQTFLHDPAGLGYGVDISTVRLGNSNLIVAEEYDLGGVTGELMFLEGRLRAYQQYFEFAHFLYARPIILHFKNPATDEEFRCQVRVTSLEKTEVDEDGIMRCPIVLYRQTLWYTDRAKVLEVDTSVSDGKQYPLDRPYHYGEVSMHNVTLFNNGVTDTPMKIEIFGECVNPMYSIYDSEGNKYGSCRMIGTYDYVSIDSDDINESITLERNGSNIPNAINYQDLTVGDPRNVYVTFLKLKPRTSHLVFTMDENFSGYARITWRDAYATV